jgi:hypothetical protein
MAIVYFDEPYYESQSSIQEGWDEDNGLRKFYRYDDHVYADLGVRVHENVFYLVKETPCGYWIRHSWDVNGEYKKWMKKGAVRQFACETKEQAMVSFKARKARQISILNAQLQRAHSALNTNIEDAVPKEFPDFLTKRDCLTE